MNDPHDGVINLALFIALLGVISFLRLVLPHAFMKRVPEAVVDMLLGIVTGLISKLVFKHSIEMPPKFFLVVLLPFIIMESGRGMDAIVMRRHMLGITLYAILGTMISVIGIGFFVYIVWNIAEPHSIPLSLGDAFAYGAVLSSIDPVATLAIFNTFEVRESLNVLVLGESLLNDATSIALFRTIAQDGGDFNDVLKSFLFVSILSVMMGFLWGFLSGRFLVWISHRVDRHSRIQSHLLFVCLAYLPYIVAELLQLSGVTVILIAVLLIFYRLKNQESFSKEFHNEGKFVSRSLSNAAEMLVFIYIGIETVQRNVWHFHPVVVIVSIMACILFRIAHVIPIARFLKHVYGETYLQSNEVSVMCFSGLRGAVSLVLALNLPETILARNTLIISTVNVVVFSIFIVGLFMGPFMKHVGF